MASSLWENISITSHKIILDVSISYKLWNKTQKRLYTAMLLGSYACLCNIYCTYFTFYKKLNVLAHSKFFMSDEFLLHFQTMTLIRNVSRDQTTQQVEFTLEIASFSQIHVRFFEIVSTQANRKIIIINIIRWQRVLRTWRKD